jgi:hypothetical protein
MSQRSKEIEYGTVKQAASGNIAAMNILFKVIEEGRFGIVKFIRDINKADDGNKIPPEALVEVYNNQCKSDIKAFVKLIDKQFRDAKRMRRDWDYGNSEYDN